jgi:hypothetical protein
VARYTASAVTTAGSTTLPIFSLYAATTVRPRLRELTVVNATATAVSLKLVRVTSAGTAGAAVARMPFAPEAPAALATTFNTHTVAPTITTGDLYRFAVAAGIGQGITLTFPDQGVIVPALANNGLAVVVSTGTGQACDVTMIWDEAD